MKMQTQNKIFGIIIFLICFFFTFSAIGALQSYFAKRTEKTIKLMNDDFPVFTVETTGGKNQDKFLLPLPVPNLNPQKYQHLITFEDEATLKSNGLEITTPLYLKITPHYDPQGTFTQPEIYFNLALKVEGYQYDDTKRPLMTLTDGIGTLKNQISIEQKCFIPNKNPQLKLFCDYELVDAQGKSFGGGSQIIENKITQLT